MKGLQPVLCSTIARLINSGTDPVKWKLNCVSIQK